MRRRKEQLEKITKYSIRKLTVGVGPVAIGAFLFGASTLSVDKVQANEVGQANTVHYRYIAEQELTDSEKALIHHEVPAEFQDDDIIYAVYRKKASSYQELPYTGSKELALAGLGLATASLAVLLISKKHRSKVLGVLLISSIGASNFVPFTTFAFENRELLSYNQTISASTHEGLAKGVIHIDGYEYIGYFKEAELHSSSPVSEKPQLPLEKQSSKEIEKTEVVQERPAVEEKPVSEKSQTRQEESLVEIPFETVTSPDANLAEGQTRIVTTGVNGQRRLVTKVSMVDGQEVREVVEDQVVQNPVSQVVAVGTKKAVELSPAPVVEPSIQAAKGTQEPGKENQALVQPELSEYTETLSTKGSQEPEHEMLSPTLELQEYHEAKGTQEEGKENQALTQPMLPEYHEAKGVQEVQEGEKQGEALVQPLPEYRIAEETTESEVEFNTEEVLDSSKYVGDDTVTREGIKGVQKTTTVKNAENNEVLATTTEVKTPAVSKIVTKGTKPVEGTTVETREEVIPFATKTEDDDTLKRGTTTVAQEGVDGKKQIIQTYKTIRGEKTNDAPRVEEKVIQEPQDKIIKQGTKGLEKPTLQWANTEKDVLKKSATASYTLTKPAGVQIKSIKLALKNKDGQLVKEVTVEENKLNATLDQLKYYQGYTLSTTMVYDRGEGEETEKLEDKQIQLDLKKVEIKNIKETSLMSVDDAGDETDKSLLTEKPTDVAPLYLRVTTHDNKTTRLAVSSVEEVVVDGKTLYKVVAKAPDLVQRRADDTLSEEYVHYFEKQKAHEGDVYYSFNDLVTAMKANPSGTFKLGADLNATNVPTPNKEYVPGKFSGHLTSVDGKQYSIHNMARQLFGNIEGGSVKNINLANVNINMPWIENISALARSVKNATVENVKVTGSILGKDGVAGIVNKGDTGGLLKNVAFIGKLTGVGNKGWDIGGIAGELWRGNIKHAYVDADIVADRARVGGLVAKTDNGSDPNGIDKYASVRNAVSKGTINVKNPIEVGGFISKNWTWGRVADTVSMMKVKNGEEFYGSRDLEAEGGYYTKNWIERNYVVKDVSEGSHSFNGSRSNRIQEISLEEANKKIESFGITADKFEIAPLVEDKLNLTKPKSDTYKDTQDYNAERELAYRNIEKLQPFYNKEWIINQGNKIPEGSKLLTTEVLSVTGMKDGQFVTDLSDVDKIMIHYADGTKEEKAVSPKATSNVEQVKEYGITDLGDVVYTPNMVVKDRAQLLSDIKAKLDSVELISPEVRNLMDKRGKAEENTDGRKDGYIKNLFLEESFKETKENLDKLVKQLVENEDHQLNTDDAAMKALVKKVEDNKAKIMMGLTYLNRYYGFKYNEMSIKDLMMFKPDFYGKNVSVLDRLIQIGSREHFLKGDRTQDAYRDVIAGATGKGNLNDFLTYNMKLFTEDTDMNVWYKKAISHTNYVVEKQSSNPDFANKKYHLYENLNNGEHGRYILPLLNTKKAHMFLISTYNTLAFSAFEKYGKNTEAEREAFKKEIDLRAQEQINYLDFWSRLAADNVRNQLLKSENMVPSAIWDNQEVPGHGWADRMGHNKNGDYAPVREFYGPTGKWHGYNGMGAYAYIFQNPQNSEAVYYIISSMISDFGTSAFTHETTHINDRMAYLGTWRHREGTDIESFAQGMLQSPSLTNYNGEYGSLGLNMAYERKNDGTQIYNYDPNMLTSREKIDHYMKNYNESMMMLDYLEAESVIKKNTGTNDKWFKRIDKKYREKADRNGLIGAPHQWDLVRDLNDTEKTMTLTTIDQLVDNNFATKHGLPGNGHYRTEGFDSAYTVINMMTGIYGGNTSESAVGSISFKHNTFRMWGYFGYLNGFLGYASNKYKQESKAAGKQGLGDDFIIQKVSNGRFNTLEEWKKEWYKEVKAKAEKGFVEIEIDGEKISTYARLQELFDAAVEKDLKGNKFDNTVNLKWKVYKALLHKSDGFAGNLFKA